MTIDTSREAVERILDGVTPGPWYWAENHPLNACANVTAEAISGWTIDIATLYGCSDGVPNPSAPDEPWGDHPIRRANARFIAAARQLVPDMAQEIADLRAERERLALAICGGEDAPGYANAQTVETLEGVARSNGQRAMADLDRLMRAEAERDAALAEVARLSHAHAAHGETA